MSNRRNQPLSTSSRPLMVTSTKVGASSSVTPKSSVSSTSKPPSHSSTPSAAAKSKSAAPSAAPVAGGSSSARAAPSAAMIAAALQSQMMGRISIPRVGPGGRATSASAALSAAKRRAGDALAQQLGLIPAPVPKLSADEWSAVRERARARGEVFDSCPICTEEFKNEEQVLLSCSHVFHKVCLRNFEKFSGSRVCPICRSKEYEKKLIDDAAVEYRTMSAIKIQAHWRGYYLRQQYRKLLELIPPKDAMKRKEFFMSKLSKTSNKLQQLMDSRDCAIDALFADIDRNVMQVRDSLSAASVQLKVFTKEEWNRIRKIALMREEKECPICCCAFGEEEKEKEKENTQQQQQVVASVAAVASTPVATPAAVAAAQPSKTTASKTILADKKSKAKAATEGKVKPSVKTLAVASVPTAPVVAAPAEPNVMDTLTKREVLLSCSHVMHHKCLLSYEKFQIASSGLEASQEHNVLQKQQKQLEYTLNSTPESSSSAAMEVPLLQPPSVCLCPLCRSNYQKTWFREASSNSA